MPMFLKDGRVRTTWRVADEPERDDGLVVSRYELADTVGYINANHIEHLEITLGDPRLFVDRAFLEAHRQRVMNGEVQPAPDHLVDLTPLLQCPQLVSLVLEGNLLHSDVLPALPALRCLCIDNTVGKNKVDLSALQLHTLHIQKPGRNVRGFEQIGSLSRLALWNYQPRSRNLSELSGLTGLIALRLIQPRLSSLDGVEALPSLRALEVYRARLLTDTSALARCPNSVTLHTDANHL